MKKIIVLLIIVSMLFAFVSVQAYTDIEEQTGTWAGEAIGYLSAVGIVNGFEDGTYKPNDNVTRAQFAKMLSVAFELSGEGSFSDIENHWAKEQINKSAGVMYAPTQNFEPDKNATRADVAYAVAKALGLTCTNFESGNKFSDIALLKDDMKEKVLAAVEKGLVLGYEDNTLRPENNVTRAEAAVIIYRAKKIINPELSFADAFSSSNGAVYFTGPAVGMIDEKVILQGELDVYKDIIVAENHEITGQDAILFLAKERIVKDESIIKLAKDLGVEIGPEFKKQFDEYVTSMNKQYEEQIGITNGFNYYLSVLGLEIEVYQRMLEVEWLRENICFLDPSYNFSEQEIIDYYNENKEFFYYDGVRAKHILISVEEGFSEQEKKEAKKKAEDIYERIQNGEHFDDLMFQNSQDPGLLEYPNGYTFTKGEMVKEFEDTAFSLKAGEVSKVIESEFGYHIIKLEEKIEYFTLENINVLQYINQALADAKFEKAVEEAAKLLTVVWK